MGAVAELEETQLEFDWAALVAGPEPRARPPRRPPRSSVLGPDSVPDRPRLRAELEVDAERYRVAVEALERATTERERELLELLAEPLEEHACEVLERELDEARATPEREALERELDEARTQLNRWLQGFLGRGQAGGTSQRWRESKRRERRRRERDGG